MKYKLLCGDNTHENLTIKEKILTNRGLDLFSIEHYLHTTDDDISDPLLLKNMERGARMLINHIAQEDKVLIQADSDADGFTSCAVLVNYLYRLFPAFVQNNLSYRIHTGKQHGILPETVADDIKLVIAPDSSSSDYEAHKTLSERGVDVLVLDHHLAEKESEYACVINNQLCDYPSKSLSGVGVVYKFCSYLDSLLGVKYADDFLDLVALGIVADMVDLRDFEAKHLVMRGLTQIRNPYFKGMVEKQAFQLRDGITPFGIAFYIAPYVNATIRVGTQDEKLTLLESMFDHRGYELIPSTKRGCKGQTETMVEQACRNCTNIKNRQTKAIDESLNLIESMIEEQNLLENKILMIKLTDKAKVDKNVRGLIANTLMSKYQRPVLVLTRREENGVVTWEGSGRGYEAAVESLKEFLDNTGFTEYASGHDNALGVCIKDEKIERFIDYTNDLLKDFDFTPSYNVDFIYSDPDAIKAEDILENAELEYVCGPGCQGLEENFVAIENIKCTKDNVFLMSPDNKPTLRIVLPNNLTLIKFRSSKEEYESLYSDLGCVTINIIGRCSKNFWNGVYSPQIKIKDYEIVDTKKYYF